MATVNKEMIKYLTRLSRIECTEAEEEALLKDLGNIITYMEQLNEIDTEDAPPCNHVLEEIANVMREDVVGTPMTREVFLSNAPSQIGGMIRVPPVIRGK